MQGVQPTDLGVPVRGTLRGIALHTPDRVVDVEEREPLGVLGAGDQSGSLFDQFGQDPGPDRVELLDMALGERPQVGPPC